MAGERAGQAYTRRPRGRQVQPDAGLWAVLRYAACLLGTAACVSAWACLLSASVGVAPASCLLASLGARPVLRVALYARTRAACN